MADSVRLTTDEQIALRAMDPQIAALRDTIAKLKRIGTIDVSEQEERLDQLIKTRDGFLREFGQPLVNRS